MQRETAEPVMTITQFDLERAVPLPPSVPRAQYAGPMQFAHGAAPTAAAKGVNKLAIAAFVCGLAGIPMFGLLTGLVAALLGAFALASIRASGERGLGLALAGLLLGIADVTGWIILLGILFFRPHPDLRFAEMPPDMAHIKELEPGLQRAMRANVVIEHGAAFFGGKSIGSGVILAINGGEALIVTNRHVVDDTFPSSADASLDAGYLARLGKLRVTMLGPDQGEGKVVWIAPGQIDLALVRSTVTSASQAAVARWRRGRPMKVGTSVFAIGNPHNLAWSHTQGVISQLRTQEIDARQMRVIQTQAAINPGNSGGGLYDQESYLLGINSWGIDKSVSEGLGFAIALDSLLELEPPPLEAQREDMTTSKETLRP